MKIPAGAPFEILREEPRWVAWREEIVKKTGATTKRAYTPGTSRLASSTRPDSWGTHAAALAMKGCDGVGFQMRGHENVAGVDLDWSFDSTGRLRSWASEIVDAAGSYVELSPTPGKGVHVWGVVDDAIPTIGINIPMGPDDQHVELYVRGGGGRYLTVTDRPLGDPHPLADISHVVRRLLAFAPNKTNGASAADAPGTNGGDPNDPDAGLAWVSKATVDLVLHGARPGADRSQELFKVVGELHDLGWSPERIVRILQAHPEGISSRCFEKGKDDVERRVRGCLRKLTKLSPPPPPPPPPSDTQSEPSEAPWAGEGAASSWDEPDLSLLDHRGELPEFPIQVLTDAWRTWALQAAHGAGASVDHVAVPLLAVLAGQIGAARRVQAVKSWNEPICLWTIVCGFSGSGKSPGLAASVRALEWIELDRADRMAELRRQHEMRQETAKVLLKKWQDEVVQKLAAKQSAPKKPPEADDPGPWVEPRLFVSDTTVERLALLIKARPRGALRINDELFSLFGNMSRYTASGTDRPFWLQAWTGGMYIVERLSRPPVKVPYLLVSLTGGLQPDRLARAFEGDDDGLASRPLFAWPQEPPYCDLSDDAVEVDPFVYNALARLVDLPAGTGDVLESRTLILSEEARNEFAAFRRFHHAGKQALEGKERAFWSKAPSQILRLSGLLAFMEWLSGVPGAPEPASVEQAHVAAAITLWRDYFWPHACACLRLIGIDDAHVEERRVLRWLRVTRSSEVSREDLRERVLSRRLDAAGTQALIDDLVKAGWLRERTIQTGGRPARRWEVNPCLY